MTVVVVGNVTEDLVFALPRLPDAGETLIATERLSDLGGKGLNQAMLLSRAGCAVRLVAAIGDDATGRRAHRLAKSEGFAASFQVVGAPTDQSIICVAASGENHIVSSAAAADRLPPEPGVAALDGLGPGDAVVVQGNLTAATTAAVLAAARARQIWTVANPSPIRWDWTAILPSVDLAVVNRPELDALGGQTGAAAATLRRHGASAVLLTLGRDGARLTDAEGETAQAAAAAIAVDTAGAGDTFLAVFVAARLHGLAHASALQAAAEVAAITVSRRGTLSAFPQRAEIAACLAAAREGTRQ